MSKYNSSKFWIKRNKRISVLSKLISKLIVFFDKKSKFYIKDNIFVSTIKLLFLSIIMISIYFCINYSLNYLATELNFNWIKSINLTDTRVVNSVISLLISFIGINGLLIGLYYSSMYQINSTHYLYANEDVNNRFYKLSFESIKWYSLLLVMSTYFIIGLLLLNNMYWITLSIYILHNLIYFLIFYTKSIVSFQNSLLYKIDTSITNELVQVINSTKSNKKDMINKTKIEISRAIVFNHFINKASIFSTISSYENKNPIYLVLLRNNIYLLEKYLNIKKNIINDSNWFTVLQSNKSWFKANEYREIMLALNTGTEINSEKTINYHYIEEEILNQIITILKNFNNISSESIYKYLKKLFKIFSENLNIDNFEIYMKYLDHISLIIEKEYDNDIILFSLISNSFINFLLDIKSKSEAINYEKYCDKIKKYYPNRLRKLYNYPEFLHGEVDNIINKIILEFRLEKQNITPIWVIENTIRNVLISDLVAYNQLTHNIIKKFMQIKARVDTLSHDKLTIIFYGDLRQFIMKLSYLNHSLVTSMEHLKKINVNMNYNKSDNFVYNLEKEVEKGFKIVSYKDIEILDIDINDEGFVDYIGSGYYNVINTILNYIVTDYSIDDVIPFFDGLFRNLTKIMKKVFLLKEVSIQFKLNKSIQIYAAISQLIGLIMYETELKHINNTKFVNMLDNYFSDEILVKTFITNIKAHKTGHNYSIDYISSKLPEFAKKITDTKLLTFKKDMFNQELNTGIDLVDDFGINNMHGYLSFNEDFSEIFAYKYLNHKVNDGEKYFNERGWAKHNVY